MRAFKVMLAVAVLCHLPLFGQQETESALEQRVEQINKTARANFTAASINLVRDVTEKRLTLYSVSRSLATRVWRVEDFKVQIIFNRDLEAVRPTL